MNYIYDIYLNYNKILYDFYEWNNKDTIIHVHKIPIFKVSTKTLIDLKQNIIKINKDFLNKICNKTEEFKQNKILKTKHSTLFSDGKDVIAIKFNKNGINHLKSSIYIDEHEELTNIIKNKKETQVEYKTIKKTKQNKFQTRFELENKIFILKELNKIYKTNNYQKINYICLECFGKTENNFKNSINKIKKEITKDNDNFYKIYNVFKSTNLKT